MGLRLCPVNVYISPGFDFQQYPQAFLDFEQRGSLYLADRFSGNTELLCDLRTASERDKFLGNLRADLVACAGLVIITHVSFCYAAALLPQRYLLCAESRTDPARCQINTFC